MNKAEELKEDLIQVWGFQRGEPCFEIFRKQLNEVLDINHQSRVKSKLATYNNSFVSPSRQAID